MRHINNFLKALVVVVITSVACIGQTLSNSIPNDGCRTSATGTLTVSTPTAQQWQEGELLGEVFYPVILTNINSKTFNYSTTIGETFYRAKINSTTYSNVIRIRNFFPPVAGTLSGSVTSVGNVGGNPVLNGSLTLSGYSGNIVKWQSSLNGTTWSDITHTSATYAFTNLAQATYFRVVVGNTSCSNVNSNSVQMNFPAPVAGTVAATVGTVTSHIATGSGSLTLTGYTGAIIKWQSSLNGTTWSDIANTTNTHAYSSITQPTYYRAVVGSYGWSDVNSNSVLINILELSGPASVYKDGIVTLTLAGSTPAVLGWEYSTDGGSNWTTENVLSSTFTIPLVVNTSFRVKLDTASHSGIGYSNVHAVTINTGSSYSQENPVTGVAGENYVHQQSIALRGITILSQVDTLTKGNKHGAFSYSDGLGRTTQTIAVKGSPLQKDVVSFATYDKYGMNSKQYLPYVATTSAGSYISTFLTDQASFYANGTSDKIEDSAFPFAETKFDNSPLFRATEQGSVGADWQIGAGHTDIISTTSNAANEVRQFNNDGTSSGFYPANELVVVEAIDKDGRKRQAISDKFGRTILTKVQLDETIGGTSVAWLETYYIYARSGDVRFVISPKGVQALKDASWVFSQSLKEQYAYQFVYDAEGRLVEKKAPGQAYVYYCFDNLNRLILMQDGNIRSQNKWFFFKYDRLGRPVMQGLYTNNTHTNRSAVQANLVRPLFSSPTAKYYEERGTAAHGYTNQIFPTSDTEVLTVNYYDSYDFDYDGGSDQYYHDQSLPGEGTPERPLGLPTGSKRLILGTSNWLSEYYFYDADGRVIQKRSNNHLSATINNLVTIVYDFEGKTTLQKTYHTTGSSTVTVLNRFVYDYAGRVKEVWQKNNSDAEQLVAQYHYNELGQLVDKKLHGTGGSFLQSVDYRYNIQGWLKSINNSQLTNDAVANDDTDDFFGMELLYNTVESGLSNDNLFSGNISAIKWKGAGISSGAENVKSYKYTYDKSNKLKSSVYQAKGVSAWNQDSNVHNESMTYDHNGNILTLQRYHRDSGSAQLMDNLTYTYNTNDGNSLRKVTDAAIAAGFDNGSSGTSNDYTYDSHGNLTKDENKGMSTIAYNALGKPSQITFTDGRTIAYTYDAAGSKLKMSVTVSGNTTTTDYVGGFVYENSALSFFGSAEGRVVKNGSNLEYQYAIADHQGNTRVVFSSVAPAPDAPLATLEPANETDERANFLKYDDVRKINAALFDHTNNGTTNYSVRLSGSSSETYGLARSLSVVPGDKVKAEVYAKYVDPNSSNWTGALSTLMSAIISGSTGTVYDGEGYGTTNGSTIPYAGVLSHGSQTGDAPKAYLNWLVFDASFHLIAAKSGFERMTEAAKENGSDVAHEMLEMPEIEITEPGYVYVYLSNENGTPIEVYFDDFEVMHTKTRVIQYNEYYPFGLQTKDSWTRENNKNNFLYNAGNELNQTSGWYEMFYRGYDPATGRMLQIDPYASSYASLNPYNYAANNPVMINDPSGGTLEYWSPEAKEREIAGRELGMSNDGAFGGSRGSGSGSSGPSSGRGSIQRWSDAMDKYINSILNRDEEYAKKNGTTYYEIDLKPGESFAIKDGNLTIRCYACGESAGLVDGKQAYYNTYWELTSTSEEQTGGDPWYNFFRNDRAGGEFLYEVNKFNPLALVVNGVNALFTGKDFERGAPMSKGDAAVAMASAIPIGRLANSAGKGLQFFGSLTTKFGNGYQSIAATQGAYMPIELGQKLNSLSPGTWSKVYEAGVLNGSKVEVHYFYNSTTGQYANPFIKMGEWGSSAFKGLN